MPIPRPTPQLPFTFPSPSLQQRPGSGAERLSFLLSKPVLLTNFSSHRRGSEWVCLMSRRQNAYPSSFIVPSDASDVSWIRLPTKESSSMPPAILENWLEWQIKLAKRNTEFKLGKFADLKVSVGVVVKKLHPWNTFLSFVSDLNQSHESCLLVLSLWVRVSYAYVLLACDKEGISIITFLDEIILSLWIPVSYS